MLFLIAGLLLVLGIICLIIAFIKSSMVLFLILIIILSLIAASFIVIGIHLIRIHKQVNEIRETRRNTMEAIEEDMESKKEVKVTWVNQILNRINTLMLEDIDESKYSKDEYFNARRELLIKKRNGLNKIYKEIQDYEVEIDKQMHDENSNKTEVFERFKEISLVYAAVSDSLDSLLAEANKLKGQMEDKVNHKINIPDHLKNVVGKYSKLIEKYLDDLKALERMMYDKELVSFCHDGLDLVEEIQEFQEETVANFREILENIDDPGLTGDIIIAFGMYVDLSKQYLAALVQKLLLAYNREKENEPSYQKAKKTNETALNNADEGLEAIIEKLHYALKRVDFELYIRDVREI